jgi:uncharacterized protein
MTEALYASYAPVFRVGGTRSGELARDLLRLEVEETTSGLKTLRADFIAVGPTNDARDEQLLYLDGKLLDFGKSLEVALGPEDTQRYVFRGAISAIEARFDEADPPMVSAFAEDRLMSLRMTRRSKTYENKSDADLARAIASSHGLSADVDADGPTYDVVQQMNMSDLAFLRERAALLAAEVWITDDKLHFKARAQRTATSLTLVKGNELLRVEIRADLAHQRTKVRVSGYDAQQRAPIDQDAGDDAVRGEVTRGRTGPSILSSAFGDRVSQRSRDVPLADGEARAWARAEMLRRARRFVVATGTTRGSPDMVVGSRLSLVNVGQPFEGGDYYATRVRHTFDLSEGMRTHFEAERATVNEVSS